MPRFKRYKCVFPGPVHDEAFACLVCDELVCGYCADPGNGSEWFCPDCAPKALAESAAVASA
jgi:hypothetical protein